MRQRACITRREMLRRLAGGIALLLLVPPAPSEPARERETVLHGSTILLRKDLEELGLAAGGAGVGQP